ncbi:VWA domain-containing protein [Candidatus Parcubacteria bacterium]|nr:VWA domain-containing protein [Candidatus Parcubacteria bacterium]
MNYSPNFLQGGSNRKLSAALAILLVSQLSFGGLFFISPPDMQADNNGNMCEADVDAVMIIDRSGSMAWDSPTRLSQAKDAANSFLSNLGANDQSALVSFATSASLNKVLSDGHSATQSAINGLIASGWTNIGDAIKLANQELSSARANPQAVKVAILLTDGAANRPLDKGDPEIYAETKAAEAAALGYKIFTIGLGSGVNETMLQNIASTTGAQYYFAPDGAALAGIYNDISIRVCEYGSISGCKYGDSDNDSDISGEDIIDGWEIVLSGDSSDTQLTDQDGCYSFTGLLPGNYTVSEGGKTGVIFAQTYPLQGSYAIDLAEGADVIEKDFGNYIPYCGNSIVDSDFGEVCEIGESQECNLGDEYLDMQYCQDCFGWGECVSEEWCGDGVINDGEECDGGSIGGYDPAHYICTNNCTIEYIPYCGDLLINQTSEECDQAESEICTTDNGYAGLQTCGSDTCLWSGCGTSEYCGDGSINGLEICDDGANNGIYDSCNQDCTGDTPSVCGNEVVEGDEECDDGPEGSDSCSIECTIIEPELSSITVCKYIDIDGLASTTDDQYLASTTVWTFILENDIATTSQATSGGCAVFNDLDSGEYAVAEELAENWAVLDPASGQAEAILENGQDITINFVNYYNEPIEPVCGDSIINQDSEECDLGADNGLLCQAGYGGTCAYCSNACTIIELTGPYCGDGTCGGGETCSTCSTDCGSCGGGGGGGGSTPLAVRGEQIKCLSETSVVITWLTNKYSTGRVVYGEEPQISIGPAPNYGYDFSTEEDANKVLEHSVVINNLAASAVYYFKPISSASPDVFGKELTFNLADCMADGCEVVVLGEEGAPELTISKTVNVDFANPGDTVVYKVNIANIGNIAAYNAVLTDTLPDGFTFSEAGGSAKTWQIGDIEPGQIQEIEYSVNISSSSAAGIFANIASASADNHNSVSASIDVEVRLVKVLAASGIDAAEYILLVILSIKLLVAAQILRRKYLHPYNVFSVKI